MKVGYEARSDAASDFISERAHDLVIDGDFDDEIIEMIMDGKFDDTILERIKEAMKNE